MNRRITSLATTPIVWLVLLSVLWSAVLAFDVMPILRGPADWTWGYKPVLALNRILPLIFGVVIYVPVGLWLRKQPRATGLLIWCSLAGLGLTLAAANVKGDVLYQFYTITVSGAPTGWHMASVRIQDLSATLRAWPQFMLQWSAFSSHMDHTPPGFILVYYGAGHLLDRLPQLADWLAQPLRPWIPGALSGYTSGEHASAWIGMLMPLWSSPTVLPLYLLGKRVFGGNVARWSALWWPLVPSFLLFSPLPNTAYALPALLVIWFLWEGLHRSQGRWVIAAGLLMSVLSFFTFTYAPLLLLAGILTLGMFWLKRRDTTTARVSWYWPLRVGIQFALGLSAVWLVFYLITGSSFVSIWSTAQGSQVSFAEIREYWHWLAFELNDFFMFTGWPLSLLAIFGLWLIIWRFRGGKELREGDVMTLAAALTIVIIDLYGTPRGEWGRIMLFLSPWVLFAAASALQEDSTGGAWATAVQAIATIVMVICLKVLPYGFRG